MIGYVLDGRERVELYNDVLIRPFAVISAAVFNVNCGFPFFGQALGVVDCEMVITAVNGVVCPALLYVVKACFVLMIFVELSDRIDRFELDCVFALFKSRKGEHVKAEVVDLITVFPDDLLDFIIIFPEDFDLVGRDLLIVADVYVLFVNEEIIFHVAASVAVVIENRFEFYGVGIKIRDAVFVIKNFFGRVFGKESNVVQCRGLGVVDTAAEYRHC